MKTLFAGVGDAEGDNGKFVSFFDSKAGDKIDFFVEVLEQLEKTIVSEASNSNLDLAFCFCCNL